MRTAFVRAAEVILAATKGQGPTLLRGLTIGFAIVAFWQQAVTGFGTDPGVQLGMGLGVLAGAVWGLSSPQKTRRWLHTADWIYLAMALAVWPLWITTLMDGLEWLPTSAWQFAGLVTAIGAGLGLVTITIPAALIVRLSHQERRAPVLFGIATVLGMVVQTIALGAHVGVWIPALVAMALCAAMTLAHEPRAVVDFSKNFRCEPADRASRWGVIFAALCLGIVAGSVQTWLADLWPVTAVTAQLSLAAVVFGGVLTAAVCRRQPAAQNSVLTLIIIAVGLFLLSAVSVDAVLWQNATLTTWWRWETVRAFELFAVWGSVGACAVLLRRSAGVRGPQAAAWGGLAVGCGMLLAMKVISPAWGPRAGFALAAAGSLVIHFALSLIGNGKVSRVTWSWRGGLTAVLIVSVWQTGVNWNTARSARLLFSTTVLLAQRSGWEPRLLERIDDARLISAFPGRHGAFTVWQNKGGEWHLRENGVPVGAISVTPAWYPQFAPEAAAALWPLVLVDQPERVLLLGAGSGAALRTCAAFPIPDVVCHEADGALIDWIQGPLAKACGFNPFADRCRWVAQPAEWLAVPTGEHFDVIVSSPRLPAQQSNLICYTAEYYRRAARHLSEEGVFCQRFSGVDLGPRPLLSAVRALQSAFAETACLEVAAGEYLLLASKSPAALLGRNLPARLENRVAQVAGVLGWDWSFPLNLPAYDGPALKEAADELNVGPHSLFQTGFAFSTPFDLMRWGPKLQETAMVLSKPRTSAPRFPLPSADEPPLLIETATHSRKSRYLEWLGSSGENPEVLRRLAELAGEHKLIRDYPDTHWWEYRKELREQLQDHPRTKVQPAKHKVQSPSDWHSEDRRRKLYFEALGELA
ncbi:MAG TPA: hypothetical protein VFG20_22505, partial [Planctomycetaceae bacterium]|nr:hypothetical protein [Planctomycetaceae bacterium]